MALYVDDDYTFDLGDLGCCYGTVVGTVDESEYGYLRIEIKSAVAHLEDKDGNVIKDLDVAKFINRATQSDICERIEAKYQAAKAQPADDFDDYDRGA